MARKTKPTVTPPSIALSISPQRALARLKGLEEQAKQMIAGARDAPQLATWRQDVQGILNRFYGGGSLEIEQFNQIRFAPFMFTSGTPNSVFDEARRDGLQHAEAFICSRIRDLEEVIADSSVQDQDASVYPHSERKDLRKVFVVHGHDHGGKEAVARYLGKLGLEPIVLHEQPDEGRTIIEKFEHYSDVACAVVILSPDDVVAAVNNPASQEKRARQNVIFEMGFFIGRLGRNLTFALLQDGVSKPSDIDGVLYIPMSTDMWRLTLARELKSAGLDVDANKAFD